MIVCCTDFLIDTMKVELESAVKFIISMLRAGHRAKLVRSKGDKFFLEPEIEMLQMSLMAVMSHQYKNYWFPEAPFRGSAYRCIRINKDKMDPIIAKAADSCGLSCNLIRSYLPDELTLWVDPSEVSYRIGEEDGSICVLYEGPIQAIQTPTKAPPAPVQHQQQHHSQSPYESSSASTSPESSSYNQTAAALDGSFSNYSPPAKQPQLSNVITFVPPSYGSPVQFVHSAYQSYPTYISS